MEFRALLNKLAETGEAFKFEQYAERLTLDVIGTAAFGHSLGAQAMGHGSSVMRLWEEMSRAHLQAREGWRIDFVRNYLAYRRREAAKSKLDVVLTELIEKRLDYVQKNDVSLENRKGSIIIDLILREYLQEMPQNSQKRMDPAFLEDILMQVRTLVAGGTGTTTDTACFTYMLLSSHPDVQKLREEHDRVFAPGIDASYETLCSDPYKLNSLDYTANVIKEAFLAFLTQRTSSIDSVVFVDGIVVFRIRRRRWKCS